MRMHAQGRDDPLGIKFTSITGRRRADCRVGRLSSLSISIGPLKQTGKERPPLANTLTPSRSSKDLGRKNRITSSARTANSSARATLRFPNTRKIGFDAISRYLRSCPVSNRLHAQRVTLFFDRVAKTGQCRHRAQQRRDDERPSGDTAESIGFAMCGLRRQ